jgi:hypothetical protein
MNSKIAVGSRVKIRPFNCFSPADSRIRGTVVETDFNSETEVPRYLVRWDDEGRNFDASAPHSWYSDDEVEVDE